MLRFLADLENANVVDLSSGRVIAQVVDIVVNPHDLSIGALVCFSRSKDSNLYLQTQDIHEFNGENIVVQNSESLADLEELVRLKEIVDINYKLVGKVVKTNTKKRVGVVSDVAFNDKSFMFDKLYVRPPVTKLLSMNDLIIGRNQVVEVSDKAIIVRDSDLRSSKKVAFGAEA